MVLEKKKRKKKARVRARNKNIHSFACRFVSLLFSFAGRLVSPLLRF
jgi:hypothetical protein